MLKHYRTGIGNLAIAALIGLLAGYLCYYARGLPAYSPGPGDFNHALKYASALVEGKNPYDYAVTVRNVPYPYPVMFFGLPWIWLPSRLAAAVHFGLMTLVLATGILTKGQKWQLLMFLSFPYAYALLYAQWSPLIVAAWFFPVIAPTLLLIKPQIVIPVFLNKVHFGGIGFAAGLMLLSLLIFPGWPRTWFNMLGPYQSIQPILQPFGFVLLLALIRIRSARARLLCLMAFLPFRGVYDLLSLYLIPKTTMGIVILILFSWVPAFYNIHAGLMVRPVWALPLLFFPALLLILFRK